MPLQIESPADLFPYNTFGMKVRGLQMTRISTPEALPEVLENNRQPLPFFILGGGSNLLLTGDVHAWVLKNECRGIGKVGEDDRYVYLKAGGGEVWHDLVMYCIERDYAGIENLALIPGTVGAAPIQNIGAYGVEVKDVIRTVHTFDFRTGVFRDFDNSECGFGYRESIFKRDYRNILFVYAVTFRLDKEPAYRLEYGDIRKTIQDMKLPLSIASVARAVIHIRQSKLPDPKEIGNSGSFFKNPELSAGAYGSLKERFPGMPGYRVAEDRVKVPAGWLIEQCGWKGYREGAVGVHPRQALVLVNYGGAAGKDIYDLSARILESVEERFGILLEREVQVY